MEFIPVFQVPCLAKHQFPLHVPSWNGGARIWVLLVYWYIAPTNHTATHVTLSFVFIHVSLVCCLFSALWSLPSVEATNQIVPPPPLNEWSIFSVWSVTVSQILETNRILKQIVGVCTQFSVLKKVNLFHSLHLFCCYMLVDKFNSKCTGRFYAVVPLVWK